MTARQIEAQRLNLIRANKIRSERSKLKLAIKAGEVDPVDVLLEPPMEAEGMVVYEFLRSLPLVGKAKAEHVLRCSHVAATRPLSSLTERERLNIASRMLRA